MTKPKHARARAKKAQAGSVQRIVLLRLAHEWRKEAEIFRRDLGACIAAADRAQVTASYRKLEYCADGLEILAQQNDQAHPTAAGGTGGA